ncbi:MAG: conjugal transfer protein TraF [Gammaproteobacteria bacterium]|nr:conjugal transfer protein TraF [Gammaproteobacteria bacterium]
MKKLRILALTGLVTTPVLATPVFHPSGSSLTYGDGASITQNIFSNVQNPASGASIFDVDNARGEFRMGLLSSIGLDVELGNLNGLKSSMDKISADLKTAEASNSLPALTAVVDGANGFLKQAGALPYIVQFGLGGHVPVFPLVIAKKNWGGSFVLDANFAVQSKVSLLDRPFEIVTTIDPVTGTPSVAPKNNSAIYLKAANVNQISLGHSRPVMELPVVGNLYAGGRMNYYIAGMRKTVVSATQANNFNTLMQDEGSKGMEFQHGIGLDMGALVVNERYQFGATFNNINSPSFNYAPIGKDCAALLPGPVQDNCYSAASYADKMNLNEKHVMNAQLRMDGAVYSKNKNWVFAAGADVNSVNDFLGNPVQRAGISGGYASRSWIIPGIRLGLHTNLVGTRLSYAALGLSFFKLLHIDAAMGLDQIKLDDTQTVPRKVALNIGLDFNF